MKVLVIGCGRMGIRHCLGAMKVSRVDKIIVVDINETALKNASEQLSLKEEFYKFSFYLMDDYFKLNDCPDIVIIASTAGSRIDTCESIIKLNPRYILIEKPLGQSFDQVNELVAYFEKHKQIKAFVNLNTRLYPAYNKLKNDLNSFPQFNGKKIISINTGTVGIGANGIHYIDLLKYLLDADKVELVTGEIDEEIIPSGRGSAFCDFGGWAVIDYKNNSNEILGRAHLLLGSQSTALGPWEIVGTNGRILIDEFEQTRFNKLRKPESDLPIQRYAGDYMPITSEEFLVPFLNDLTFMWLEELLNGNYILPELKESLKVHEVLFNWLALSKTHKKNYPIT